jgi:hypothetical protein
MLVGVLAALGAVESPASADAGYTAAMGPGIYTAPAGSNLGNYEIDLTSANCAGTVVDVVPVSSSFNGSTDPVKTLTFGSCAASALITGTLPGVYNFQVVDDATSTVLTTFTFTVTAAVTNELRSADFTSNGAYTVQSGGVLQIGFRTALGNVGGQGVCDALGIPLTVTIHAPGLIVSPQTVPISNCALKDSLISPGDKVFISTDGVPAGTYNVTETTDYPILGAIDTGPASFTVTVTSHYPYSLEWQGSQSVEISQNSAPLQVAITGPNCSASVNNPVYVYVTPQDPNENYPLFMKFTACDVYQASNLGVSTLGPHDFKFSGDNGVSGDLGTITITGLPLTPDTLTVAGPDSSGNLSVQAGAPSSTVHYTLNLSTGGYCYPPSPSLFDRVTLQAPAGVTVTPSAFNVTGCGGDQPVQVNVAPGTQPGTYAIKATMSSPYYDAATYFDTSGASFNVVVPQSAQPPTVQVTGVQNGQPPYNAGSVPTPGCNVTDPQNGSASTQPVVTFQSGPDQTDGIGTFTAVCTYSNAAGTAKDTVTYTVVDPTAPVVTDTVTPAVPNGNNGWYNGNVSVSWNVSDPESPSSVVKTGCQPQSITADQAATNYTCSASSAGGYSGLVTVTIKRDGTGPTMNPSLTPSTPPLNPGGLPTVLLNANVTATASASDSLSGLASSSCDAVTTTSVGLHQVACHATDNAGNPSTVLVSYNVVYKWVGYAQPINDTGHNIGEQLSVFHAGQTIPVILTYQDANGTAVLPATAPVWLTPVSLGVSKTPVDDSVPVVNPSSGSSFTCDPVTKACQFNWKTTKAQAGQWWQVAEQGPDGVIQYVEIGLN